MNSPLVNKKQLKVPFLIEPFCFKVPPTVNVQSNEVLSYTGNEAVEIICRVSGLPKPQISWYKLNGELPVNAEVKENGNLVLKNLSKIDAGVYKCVGRNDLGSSEELAEVRVQGKKALSKIYSLTLRVSLTVVKSFFKLQVSECYLLHFVFSLSTLYFTHP